MPRIEEQTIKSGDVKFTSVASQAPAPESIPLPVNSTLTAEVVVRESKDSYPTTQKGVIINGKFVEVELPEDVEAGDKVMLKVVRTGETKSLEFVSKESAPRSVKESAQFDIIKNSLENFVRNNDKTKELFTQIFNTLKLENKTKEGFLSALTDNQKQKLEEIIQKSGVLTESDLKKPEELLKKLTQQKSNSSSDIFKNAQKEIEQIKISSGLGDNLEKIKTLEASIVKLLKLVEPDFKYEIPAKTAIPDKQFSRENIKSSEQPIVKPEIRLTPGSIEAEIEEKFNQILDKLASPELKVELKKILARQSEELKSVERNIKELLASSGLQSSIETLYKIVKNFDTSENPNDNQTQAELKLFVIDLKKSLELISKSEVTAEKVKELLKTALLNIYQDFKIIPFDLRVLGKGETESPLDPQQVNFLKSLEAQIKNILNSPDSIVEEFSDSAAKFKSGKVLKDFLEFFRHADKGMLSQSGLDLEEIESKVNKALLAGSKSEAENQIRVVLKSALNTLTPRIDNLTNNLVSVSNVHTTPTPWSRQSATLSPAETEFLHKVEGLIRDLLNSGDKLIEAIPGKNINPLISAPEFKKLIKILSDIEKFLPDTLKKQENGLIEFAADLMNQIEEGVTKSSATSLNETLKKAIETIHKKFLPESILKDENPLLKIEQSVLKNIENVIQGQDVMNRLNPLIKLSGEPVVMLFPFILGGMISQLEIRKSHSDRMFSGEDFCEKGKDEGNTTPFEKVAVKMPFLGLGEVSLDLAHRKGEILINMQFADKEKIAFVGKRLVQLQAKLGLSGYSKISLNLSEHGRGEEGRSAEKQTGANPSLSTPAQDYLKLISDTFKVS